jgi:hypothetical protein
VSRQENRVKMGFFPLPIKHHEAVLSLVAPATPATRIIDPFAGEGVFLEAAAQVWNATPYACELDGKRAQQCIERFGPKQAVQCDAERLRASNTMFGLLWCNPPYDHDATATESKRVEFAMLRHSWKWSQDGGIVMWVIYQQHLTEKAMTFLAKHSHSVDVWALPGKHLNEYDQVIVVAIKGHNPDPETLYQNIATQKSDPRPLTVQSEPIYRMLPPNTSKRFIFTPDMIDEDRGLLLVESQGAWKTNGFQALLDVPPQIEIIKPVVAPRPGHMALVLAAGVADGAVIETADYGRVALRGKTQTEESINRVEIEQDPKDDERQIKKTFVRLKPSTILTLLSQDGTLVEMEGDDALLEFITTNRKALADYLNARFEPMYEFEFNSIGRWLSRIRLHGKYPLYTAQKHVVGAITRGFQERDSIFLIGQMGVGKTCLGGSAAIAIASGAVKNLQQNIGADQVILIVAPPHLLDKWKRELLSINGNIYVEKLNRHEDIKAFMDKSARLGQGIAKIGLIKRDMTKLGAGFAPAVIWRNEPVALWHKNAPVPEGYEDQPRVIRRRVPKCPHCGNTVMKERKGQKSPASKTWLKSGKRQCSECQSALWQMKRGKGSQPKPGYKFPPKNPRYRIDQYLKQCYPNRVYMLIWDEVHEAQKGDTGNGVAFSRMAGLSQKVLAMTGTPFNGRSSSLFNIEYSLNPRVRQRYAVGGAARLTRKIHGNRGFQQIIEGTKSQRGRAEAKWVADMGVRERVVEERPSYNSETGAYTGTSTYERPYQEAPGISPLLVAEVLDHAIFFSLADLGKNLPDYEEVAVPVEMDGDTYEEYDQTRQALKDYLISRRWEGDTSFRGSYLQWSMGWPNASFRPHQIIHNMRDPFNNEKRPYTVRTIPSYGEDRVYAKEQTLIDTVQAELAGNRPVIVYLRQTGTRDIQPRIEKLLARIPGAKPYILKNTVSAERREKVIEMEVGKGANVVICNPELTKTGLDLIFAPTIIFAEITFNLSTMMQASARSYRLNQTYEQCKVIYLYYQGTMEESAVHLMSRKQRAAKLLTGDIGLTGLDALTEGEGGFEQALLNAIGREESLVNPAELFKRDDDIDSEDAAFWNVEIEEAEYTPVEQTPDSLVVFARQELGAIVAPRNSVVIPKSNGNGKVKVDIVSDESKALVKHVGGYLDDVHIISDHAKRAKLQAKLLGAVMRGVDDANRDVAIVVGVKHPDFFKYPVHRETLTRWIVSWLKKHRFVFAGCEEEVAAKVIDLTALALNLQESKLEMLPKKAAKRRRKKKIDMMAVPEDEPEFQPEKIIHLPQIPDLAAELPQQLALL